MRFGNNNINPHFVKAGESRRPGFLYPIFCALL
jgi:hypothetical protein